MKNIFRNKKGFSLIEMMVVVVILGLVVLALVTFFTGGTISWMAGQSQLKAQREARQAIDRMVREIREAKNITTGLDNSITVDIPSLGGNAAYSVNYFLHENTIKRASNPIIDNVKILFFTYAYPTGSTNILDVSKVHILLEVDVDKDSNPDITLNTDVNLRNFDL